MPAGRPASPRGHVPCLGEVRGGWYNCATREIPGGDVRARGVAAVLALVMLGGCAVEEGAPTSKSSTSTPQSTEPSVPAVVDPIDLAGYDPCDLIGPADVGIVGYGTDVQMTQGSDECNYYNGGRSGSMTITLYRDASPLVSAYERDARTYEKFEPRKFHGYPGVVEVETIEGGVCVVIVGMADDQGVMLLKYPDMGRDPATLDTACSLLALLGDRMMENLGA